MNVGQLRELLDEYGDHLAVVIGGEDQHLPIQSVDSDEWDDEIVVALWAGVV